LVVISSITSSILASSSIIVKETTVTIIVVIRAEITSSAVIPTVTFIVKQDRVRVDCASLHDKFNLIDRTVFGHCFDGMCFAVLSG